MARWADLTDKQKKKFGGSKKNFRSAKKQIKSSGGNIASAKQVVKQHKRNNSSGGGGGGSSSNNSGGGGGGGASSAQVQNFNYGSTVGNKDVRRMQEAGFSDAQIKSVAERAGVGNVKASIQRKIWNPRCCFTAYKLRRL